MTGVVSSKFRWCVTAADIVSSQEDRTALILAIAQGQKDISRLLLGHSADVEAKDNVRPPVRVLRRETASKITRGSGRRGTSHGVMAWPAQLVTGAALRWV